MTRTQRAPRSRPRRIRAADLFCGAGGTSSGLARACLRLGLRLDLTAVNHWPVAIETHAANHPAARHLCANLDGIDPAKAVPGGKLDLLIAAPECTHHSRARGGKPCSDQSRASAWQVVRWADALRPRSILVENVRELATWGPLDSRGRPLVRRRGETFAAWLAALRSLGYAVSHRVLNAADHGDATTRERLFVLARLGRTPPVWPEPSHARNPAPGLFGSLPRWRAAREVIDWSLRGKSIFTRKHPLKPSTLARIEAGLHRYAGAESYLVNYYGSGGGPLCLNDPLDTVTTCDRFGLVEVCRQAGIDILFRMLQPHELAAAHSFPAGYRFSGNRGDQVKQIGNSVPVGVSAALCEAILGETLAV